MNVLLYESHVTMQCYQHARHYAKIPIDERLHQVRPHSRECRPVPRFAYAASIACAPHVEAGARWPCLMSRGGAHHREQDRDIVLRHIAFPCSRRSHVRFGQLGPDSHDTIEDGLAEDLQAYFLHYPFCRSLCGKQPTEVTYHYYCPGSETLSVRLFPQYLSLP